MATTEWVSDQAGIARFEERDPELNATMAAYARMAVATAQRIAPVGSPVDDDEHIGAYRDAFGYEKIENGPGYRVFNSDNKAHWIEYGAAHMRAHRVLGRAVGAGGEFGNFG